MLTESQLKALTDLKLSDYPEFCIWENSIVRTKILSLIWSLARNREVTILDVGCGGARMWRRFLKNMPHISVYGFDPDEKAVATACDTLKGLNAKVCKSGIDYTHSIFPEVPRFDFVVSHSVLEHVVPRHLFFNAIGKRLTDGGAAMISWGADHFRQGLRTDLRNYFSRFLALMGVERYYAREVDEQWAKSAIEEASLEINILHYYSIVELKKLFRLSPEGPRTRIFQDWIRIEEEFNRSILDDPRFAKRMDETFVVLTKKTADLPIHIKVYAP